MSFVGITAVILVALGCAGMQTLEPLPPLPPRATAASLYSPFCGEDSCTCQDGVAPTEHELAEGQKVYEIRIGPSDNELWATLGDQVFYKTGERATECFYVELAPGEHPMTLRAARETGFAARLEISEMAPSAMGWYDTFNFNCGPACDNDGLVDFKRRIDSYKNNLHDPCGSTKIRRVTWQKGRMPDMQHPAELNLEFVLHTYKFTPQNGPGAAECAGK